MLPASAPDLERGVAPLLCAFTATCTLARPSGQEELPHAPKPEARGGGREEQPHLQGAIAVWAQEGLEELSYTEGQEGWQ